MKTRHGNLSRSILFDEEFESALLFLKKSKAIFSVCDVITRKVYFNEMTNFLTDEVLTDKVVQNIFSLTIHSCPHKMFYC